LAICNDLQVWKLKFESSYEGYNFVVGSPSIKVHVKKLWACKVVGFITWGILRFPSLGVWEK
jgi:hypothetical protein